VTHYCPCPECEVPGMWDEDGDGNASGFAEVVEEEPVGLVDGVGVVEAALPGDDDERYWLPRQWQRFPWDDLPAGQSLPLQLLHENNTLD